MNLERFCIKFFARSAEELDESKLIDIFQEWIRLRRLNLILLDAADYRHVPDGPGVMLITHEINFAADHTDGRFGLLAQRKQGQAKTHQAAILELVEATIAAAHLLESDPRLEGRLTFEAGSFEYQANDRLLAPNDAGTYTTLLPDLQAVAAVIYPGRPVTITRVENDPRQRLAVRIDAGDSLEVAALVHSLGVAA